MTAERLIDWCLTALVIVPTSFIIVACSTTGKTDLNSQNGSGSISWNWNQTPHGGSDEKSSVTPAEELTE